MPDLTPAAELRAASATLKAAALSAQESSPTPWTPDDPMDPELRWIALMDPGMGPPLADWLDAVSSDIGDHSECIGKARCELASALAVARSLNTPTEEPTP